MPLGRLPRRSRGADEMERWEKELAALGRSVDAGQDGKGIQVRLRGPLR